MTLLASIDMVKEDETHYSVLGVSSSATNDEITKARRKLLFKVLSPLSLPPLPLAHDDPLLSPFIVQRSSAKAMYHIVPSKARLPSTKAWTSGPGRPGRVSGRTSSLPLCMGAVLG